MRIIAAITDLAVAKRILLHCGLFELPRPPTPHDCPPPPAAVTDPTLLFWPHRQTRNVHPSPESDPPFADEAGDPSPSEHWPVDPPFPEN